MTILPSYIGIRYDKSYKSYKSLKGSLWTNQDFMESKAFFFFVAPFEKERVLASLKFLLSDTWKVRPRAWHCIHQLSLLGKFQRKKWVEWKKNLNKFWGSGKVAAVAKNSPKICSRIRQVKVPLDGGGAFSWSCFFSSLGKVLDFFFLWDDGPFWRSNLRYVCTCRCQISCWKSLFCGCVLGKSICDLHSGNLT